MTYQTHAASAPAGERLIVLIELHQASWPTVLRFARTVADQTVVIDGETVTFTAIGFDGESASAQETAIDERKMRAPDDDGLLWRRIRANIGSTETIKVTVYEYLSTDMSTPLRVTTLDLVGPGREKGSSAVSFQAASIDIGNMDGPAKLYTWANSPGLRR